ncbi:Uncharacterised protein [uncultured archaeon]|nr:Uncharacterised protein [uncultured archaeon]
MTENQRILLARKAFTLNEVYDSINEFIKPQEINQIIRTLCGENKNIEHATFTNFEELINADYSKNRFWIINLKQENLFLFVDTSGYDYARYIGIISLEQYIKQPKEQETLTIPEVLGFEEEKSFKVGDVLYHSWGYDQTNIDFYKIIEISKTGKTAKLIRLMNKVISSTQDGFVEQVVPGQESENKKLITARIKEKRIGRFWKWNNKPLTQTSYA